jgi:UDP-glucose 4-epimerase
MKYVVTGGAGFIGSHIVDLLIINNHNVHVIDNFSSGKKDHCNSNAAYYELDISNLENNGKLNDICNCADGIFHVAASVRVQDSIKRPLDFELNNTIGIVNMLNVAKNNNVKRLIYSSSSSIYGDTTKLPSKEDDPIFPISPYAMQKYYGEVCCKTYSKIYSLETASLRYFNVYGERQSLDGAYPLVISAFAKQRLENKPLTIRGDGNQKRDFTHVSDIANANYLAMKSNNIGKGEVINIGRSNSKSINEVAEMMGGDKIFVDPVIEPKENLSDNNKAKKLLDWEPKINIEDWIPNYKKQLGIIDE